MTAQQGPPATIAVDLTPLLPGGENGGAKIYVVTLMEALSDVAPATQFVLLTQFRSHEELAALDRPNVRRVMVVGDSVGSGARSALKRYAGTVLRLMPGRVRNTVAAIGFRFDARLKRGASASIVRDLGADLLFCPFTAPTFRSDGVPTVSTVHDLLFKEYPFHFAPEFVAHRNHTFVEACRHADALVTISEYSRRAILAAADIASRRVRTIPHRMARRLVRPGDASTVASLEHWGLQRDRYLVYPANFWPHKNHEALITAFGMARQSGLDPAIRLVMTGSPGERQDWLSAATIRLGLADAVAFVGFVSNDELAMLVGGSRGLIFPSLYEGFGLPILEAMGAGVPVACGDRTALPEVAGGAALLFDPRKAIEIAQAMITLASNEGERRRLIDAGRARALEFADARRMAADYLALFADVFSSTRYSTAG